MRKKKYSFTTSFFLLVLLGGTLFSSCRKEEGISLGSNIVVASDDYKGLNKFIYDSLTKKYNIEVIYKFKESLLDHSRYLYPPHVDSAKNALDVIRKVWIEPYVSLAGENFIRRISPRQVVLVGSRNYNPNQATVTLGVAEAGKRITLFEVNLLNMKSRASINRFVKTLQHEYTHILNQTVPFDEGSYEKITPSNYTAQWFNKTDADSRALGYITNYSRAAPTEDFAEMLSEMLLRSKTEWDALINAIVVKDNPEQTKKAKADIRQKEKFVASYMKEEFGIDIYELQDSCYQKTLRLTQ